MVISTVVLRLALAAEQSQAIIHNSRIIPLRWPKKLRSEHNPNELRFCAYSTVLWNCILPNAAAESWFNIWYKWFHLSCATELLNPVKLLMAKLAKLEVLYKQYTQATPTFPWVSEETTYYSTGTIHFEKSNAPLSTPDSLGLVNSCGLTSSFLSRWAASNSEPVIIRKVQEDHALHALFFVQIVLVSSTWASLHQHNALTNTGKLSDRQIPGKTRIC